MLDLGNLIRMQRQLAAAQVTLNNGNLKLIDRISVVRGLLGDLAIELEKLIEETD